MSTRDTRRDVRGSGFSLVELMVALTIFGLVMAGACNVFLMCLQWWYRSDLLMRASSQNNHALERLVYGAGGQGGLREADAAVVASNAAGWTLTYRDGAGTTQAYAYSRSPGTIVYTPRALVVCSNVLFASAETNAVGNGLGLRVDVQVTEGRYSCSNSMSTFVGFRNFHAK